MKLFIGEPILVESIEGVEGSIHDQGGALVFSAKAREDQPILLISDPMGRVRLMVFDHPDDKRRWLAFHRKDLVSAKVHEVKPEGPVVEV